MVLSLKLPQEEMSWETLHSAESLSMCTCESAPFMRLFLCGGPRRLSSSHFHAFLLMCLYPRISSGTFNQFLLMRMPPVICRTALSLPDFRLSLLNTVIWPKWKRHRCPVAPGATGSALKKNYQSSLEPINAWKSMGHLSNQPQSTLLFKQSPRRLFPPRESIDST